MNRNNSYADVYQNGVTVPSNLDEPVYAMATTGRDIDGDAADQPAEVTLAQAELATELHCLHLSFLNTLGDIISQDTDADTKRIATALSSAHMRSMDTWGWYMKQAGKRTHISAEMNEHIADIASDDSLCQLMAVTLNGIFAQSLHRHHDADDSMFGQILQQEAEQGAKNLEMTEQYLRQRMAALQAGRQQDVFARIEKCIDWTEQYMEAYRDMLDTVSIDGDAVMEDFRTYACSLYRRICSEVDVSAEEKREVRVQHRTDR